MSALVIDYLEAKKRLYGHLNAKESYVNTDYIETYEFTTEFINKLTINLNLGGEFEYGK